MQATLPLIALLTFCGPAHADVFALWNFNSNPADGVIATGTIAPAIGSGFASLVGGTTATFASGLADGGSSDPALEDNSAWNTTTYPVQGSGNVPNGVQFVINAGGYTNVLLNYDLRHSASSSHFESVQISLDGVNFTEVAVLSGPVGEPGFNARSVDLSAFATDNALFLLRISAATDFTGDYLPSALGTSYSPSGTWRFDQVTLSGIPLAVPEATSYAQMLAGLALLALAMRRRCRAERRPD